DRDQRYYHSHPPHVHSPSVCIHCTDCAYSNCRKPAHTEQCRCQAWVFRRTSWRCELRAWDEPGHRVTARATDEKSSRRCRFDRPRIKIERAFSAAHRVSVTEQGQGALGSPKG